MKTNSFFIAFTLVLVANINVAIGQNQLAELANGYKLSNEQIDKVSSLMKEKESEIKAINDTVYYGDKRQEYIAAIEKKFEISLKGVMPPQQYELWLEAKEAQQKRIKELDETSDAKISDIYKMKIPFEEKQIKIDVVDKEYVKQLTIVIGEAEALRKMQEIYILRVMSKYANLNLYISYSEAQKMSALNTEVDSKISEAKAKAGKYIYFKAEKERLEDYRHSKIEEILGEERYLLWANIIDGRYERTLIIRYSLSEDQLNKFLEATNKANLDAEKIKKSSLEYAEKYVELQKIAEQYDNSLKTILSKEQYDKYIEDQKNKIKKDE